MINAAQLMRDRRFRCEVEVDGKWEKQEITSYNLISYETRLVCDLQLKVAVKSTKYDEIQRGRR